MNQCLEKMKKEPLTNMIGYLSGTERGIEESALTRSITNVRVGTGSSIPLDGSVVTRCLVMDSLIRKADSIGHGKGISEVRRDPCRIDLRGCPDERSPASEYGDYCSDSTYAYVTAGSRREAVESGGPTDMRRR